MSKRLNILFVPIDGVSHVNSCIGLAEVLIENGHRVIFAINKQWKETLIKYGIEVILLPEEQRDYNEDPAKYWAKQLVSSGVLKATKPLDNAISFMTTFMPTLNEMSKILDKQVEEVLEKLKPDVIILDQGCSLPSVILSGIPWVLTCSPNPLFQIDDERTPPSNSGLPEVESEKEWKDFRNTIIEVRKEEFNKFNDYLVSRGVMPLKPTSPGFINDSPYLNIYAFPKELDYIDLRPLPPNWCAFDSFIRSEKQSKFEIPVEFREKSGKMIYFSLGTMGVADVALMKRLVAILAKSKHRFIVSKGPSHDTYELPNNMFGQQIVPQIQVLPTVDLVITHGGKNTVTEALYFAKPMIVMPLFVDQWDNAQRVHEKGFGIRLNPYECSETELLNSIDSLLNNKELNEKLLKVSKRIQSENSIGKLPKLIENLVNIKVDINCNLAKLQV